MRELPILTTELTLKLEESVAPMETEREANGSEVVRFGRTIARKVMRSWPPSGVYCFGAEDVGKLDEILGFFEGIEPVFYLGHGGFSPEVGRALHGAGYCLQDWKQTILYGLPMAERAVLPEKVSIELVTEETIEVAAEVTAEGNEWPVAWRENAKKGVRRTIGEPGLKMFLARYDGEPAGVGNLTRSNGSEKWCGVAWGAVIRRFRGKGIHTALLRHRLHAAFAAGFELVVGGADFGSVSFRNQQRLGMRLGYIETAWKRLKTKEEK